MPLKGDRKRHGGPADKRDPIDAEKLRLVELIVRLGDDRGFVSLEANLLNLVTALSDPVRFNSLITLLFDCITSFPTKTSIYATLIALLGRENGEIVEAALQHTKLEISRSFLHANYRSLKLLFRFIAELANANVIPHSSAYELYNQLLDIMLSTPSLPQHLLDAYLFIITTSTALIYDQQTPKNLLEKLETAFQKRMSLYWLSSFDSTTATGVNDLCISELNYSSGSQDWLELFYADFLQFVSASQDEASADSTDATIKYFPSSISGRMRLTVKPWKLPQIQERLLGSSTSPKQLLNAQNIDWFGPESNSPQDLAQIMLMERWITSQNQTRISHGLSLYTYPQDLPRASFSKPRLTSHIFPKQRTSGEGKHALSYFERVFLSDYILDIAHAFRSSPADITFQMSFFEAFSEILDPFAFFVEVLLLDILSAAGPELAVSHHAAIIYNCILKNHAKELTFNEAMDRLFSSMAHIRPMARYSLVNFFSVHLNSFEYKWHWKEWSILEEKAAAAKIESAQISPMDAFVREVLAKAIRLSYYERISAVIKAAVPERAAKWLGSSTPTTTPSAGSHGSDLARQVLDKVKSRPSKPEEILDPITSLGSSVSNTSEEIASIIFRALLADSVVSLSMLQGAFNRYAEILRKLATNGIGSLGAPLDCNSIFLSTARDFSEDRPQQLVLITNVMMSTKLLTPIELVRFFLKPGSVPEERLREEILMSAARHSLLSVRTLETELLNQTLLAAKYESSSDLAAVAGKTMEKPASKEIISRIGTAAENSKSFFVSYFSGLLDLILRAEKGETVEIASARDFFFQNVLSFSSQFAVALPSLDSAASALSPSEHAFYTNLSRFAVNN